MGCARGFHGTPGGSQGFLEGRELAGGIARAVSNAALSAASAAPLRAAFAFRRTAYCRVHLKRQLVLGHLQHKPLQELVEIVIAWAEQAHHCLLQLRRLELASAECFRERGGALRRAWLLRELPRGDLRKMAADPPQPLVGGQGRAVGERLVRGRRQRGAGAAAHALDELVDTIKEGMRQRLSVTGSGDE